MRVSWGCEATIVSASLLVSSVSFLIETTEVVLAEIKGAGGSSGARGVGVGAGHKKKAPTAASKTMMPVMASFFGKPDLLVVVVCGVSGGRTGFFIGSLNAGFSGAKLGEAGGGVGFGCGGVDFGCGSGTFWLIVAGMACLGKATVVTGFGG